MAFPSILIPYYMTTKKPKAPEKLQAFTTRLGAKDKKALSRLAKKLKISESAVVRMAIASLTAEIKAAEQEIREDQA